jgi:hypothetical protein
LATLHQSKITPGDIGVCRSLSNCSLRIARHQVGANFTSALVFETETIRFFKPHREKQAIENQIDQMERFSEAMARSRKLSNHLRAVAV